MALKGNGTSGWTAPGLGIQASAQPGYTLFCWARNPGGTATTMLCWASNTNFIHTQIGTTNGPNGYFWDNVDDAFTDIGVSSTTTFSSLWVPVCVSCKSQAGGTLYVGNPATTYTLSGSLVAQTLAKVCLATDEMNGTPMAATESVAECAIWNDALGVGEIGRLMSGACPLTVAPASLYCYFPLRFDLRDYGPAGLAATGVTPVFTDHPPVQNFVDVINYDGWELFNQLYSKAVAVAQAEVVAVPLVRGRPLAASDASVASLTAALVAHVYQQAASAASSYAAALMRRRSLPIAAATAEAFSIGFTRLRNWFLSAVQPEAMAVVRASGRSYRATSAEIAALQRSASRALTTLASPQSVRLIRASGVTRAAVSANSAALLRTANKRLGSALAQALFLAKVLGRQISVASAAAYAITRGIPLRLSAASPEATGSPLGVRAYVRTLPVLSPQSPLLTKGMAALHTAASGNTASLVRTTGRLLGAAEASVAAILKGVGRLPGAATASVGALLRSTHLPRGVASPSVATLQQPTVARLFATLHAALAQIAQLRTIRAKPQVMAASDANVAAAARNPLKTNPATVAAVQPQVAAVSRGVARSFAAVSASVAALRKNVGPLLGLAAGSAAALITIAHHFLVLPVVSPSVAFLRASYALARGVVSAQAVHLTTRRGLFLAAISNSLAALPRSIGYPIGLASEQTVTLARFIGKAFAAASPNSASLVRAFYRVLSATSAQTAHAIVRYGSSIGGVITASSAALLRRSNKLLGFGQPEALASGRIDTKVIGATTSNVAALQTPRGFLLGAVQGQIARVVHWYYLFVADWSRQQSTLLPPGGGPAEPPTFGPIDPADQTTFAFDWSKRADPNDTIVSATVVSVPPGLVFAPAPVFIRGTLVEVTVAPFTLSLAQLPMTYSLRCSAVFASGRRSSFSIPVPVRSL